MVYGQVDELDDELAVLKVAFVAVLLVNALVVLMVEKMAHCVAAERVVHWAGDSAYTPDSEMAELSASVWVG